MKVEDQTGHPGLSSSAVIIITKIMTTIMDNDVLFRLVDDDHYDYSSSVLPWWQHISFHLGAISY